MKAYLTILLALFTFFALTFSAPIDLAARESLELETIELETRDLESRASGRGTYYDVGLGSCGWTNSNSQMVCALSGSIMKGYKSSWCGKSITIKSGGKSHSCKVVDTCPSCSSGSVDMSPALFKKFAPLSKGVLSITWS